MICICWKFVVKQIPEIYSGIFNFLNLRKGEYLLKHPLNLNLNIAHLSGYFMEDKLITEQAAKSVSRMIFKGSMHLF